MFSATQVNEKYWSPVESDNWKESWEPEETSILLIVEERIEPVGVSSSSSEDVEVELVLEVELVELEVELVDEEESEEEAELDWE